MSLLLLSVFIFPWLLIIFIMDAVIELVVNSSDPRWHVFLAEEKWKCILIQINKQNSHCVPMLYIVSGNCLESTWHTLLDSSTKKLFIVCL